VRLYDSYEVLLDPKEGHSRYLEYYSIVPLEVIIPHESSLPLVGP
jgi:hypothetical protein